MSPVEAIIILGGTVTILTNVVVWSIVWYVTKDDHKQQLVKSVK